MLLQSILRVPDVHCPKQRSHTAEYVVELLLEFEAGVAPLVSGEFSKRSIFSVFR